MRPLWVSASEDFLDRGPLATVSRAPATVRRAAEPAHRTAFRQQEEREERWEKERRDRERQELRRTTDISYYLSGQRVLEAAGVDFGGHVVIPELSPRADSGLAMAAPGPAIRNPLPLSSVAGTIYESEARAPAVSPGNIVLLPFREEHLRDRVHDPVPDERARMPPDTSGESNLLNLDGNTRIEFRKHSAGEYYVLYGRHRAGPDPAVRDSRCAAPV